MLLRIVGCMWITMNNIKIKLIFISIYASVVDKIQWSGEERRCFDDHHCWSVGFQCPSVCHRKKVSINLYLCVNIYKKWKLLEINLPINKFCLLFLQVHTARELQNGSGRRWTFICVHHLETYLTELISHILAPFGVQTAPVSAVFQEMFPDNNSLHYTRALLLPTGYIHNHNRVICINQTIIF